MKKMMIAAFLSIASLAATAQVQFNPQLGVTLQDFKKYPANTDFTNKLGFQVGADLRFGDRTFFQPGAFLSWNKVGVHHLDSDVTVEPFEQDITTTNLKLRALAGARIIDNYQFDMRLAVGPALNVMLAESHDGDNALFQKGDLRNGVMSIDAALGFDFGYLTLEPSVSIGLGKAFNDRPDLLNLDSKPLTYGMTLGINLGNDD